LAVSPANVDLVNSEALKLARQVDPQGRRTIGVMSKLDLMDHGTNALEILSGRVYPLKLGFIGVVNRSQQDIVANKSLSEALKSERDFFKQHAAYRTMAHRCGTQYLAKSLNSTLMQHIRERLPDIKAKLNTLMGQTQQELASYGDIHFHGKEHRGSLILQLMTRFANSFISSIDGTSSEISTKELCGGARVYYVFNNVFGSALDTIDPTTNLSVSDIRTAIRNSTGPRPSLFVPELAFDLLVKPQIKLLEIPSQRCVEMVYEELTKVCHSCGSTESSRFPKLQAKLIECVSDLLRERLRPTSSYVESLISIQRAYINTNHPNFLGAAAAMSSVMNSKEAKEKKVRETARKERRSESRRGGAPLSRTNGTTSPVEESDEHDFKVPKEQLVQPEFVNGSPINHHSSQHHPRSVSASGTASGTAVSANARDSFLNYFFGKEGKESSAAPNASRTPEPTFTSSIRRPESTPLLDAHHPIRENNESFMTDEPVLSDREQMETELIRKLITSYFSIVRETIQDQVPKAIMHLLVNHCKDAVQNRLVAELYREDLFGDLLHEDETLAQERQKCEKMLSTYKVLIAAHNYTNFVGSVQDH